MLHDPGSYAPPVDYDELPLSASERETLRRLGAELAP
jgi:hypothetical protein